MFDISWTEFLLIGVVALVVIGPKELPGVLRTLGQWTRKVRGMATEFQNQFQEAMREAEMADLKKQVDDIAHDFKHYDPLKDVREDVEAAGRDIQSSLDRPPEAKAGEPAAAELPAGEPALIESVAEASAVTTDAAATPALETSADPQLRGAEAAGEAHEGARPAAETAQPEHTERAG